MACMRYLHASKVAVNILEIFWGYGFLPCECMAPSFTSNNVMMEQDRSRPSEHLSSDESGDAYQGDG